MNKNVFIETAGGEDVLVRCGSEATAKIVALSFRLRGHGAITTDEKGAQWAQLCGIRIV